MAKGQQPGSGGTPPKKHRGFTSEMARKVRPAQPALRHGLYSPVTKAQWRKAVTRLVRQYPHLKRVDVALVRSFAALTALVEAGWMFFLTPGHQIASASHNKTRWDPGLAQLLSLDRQRLEVAKQLRIVPVPAAGSGVRPITEIMKELQETPSG